MRFLSLNELSWVLGYYGPTSNCSCCVQHCVARFQVPVGLPSFRSPDKLAAHSALAFISRATEQVGASFCSFIFMCIALQWPCGPCTSGCFEYKVSPNSSFLRDSELVREAHFVCALFQKCAIKLLSEQMMGSCCVSWRRDGYKSAFCEWASAWWSIKLISFMIDFSKAIAGFGICGICSISNMLNMDP